MNLYLDASVILPRLVEEPGSDDVRALLANEEHELLVSDFAATEVASAMSRLVRMGRLTAVDAAGRLDDFDTWRAGASSRVDIQASDALLAYAFVRRFEAALRAPDAMHLAIVRRLDSTLVTLDKKLAGAADTFGVAVVMPVPDMTGDWR